MWYPLLGAGQYHCYQILLEGLVRTETLVADPNCRNFLLARKKSASRHLPYSDMDALVDQLR